jgi:hypothetical protein
MGFRAVMTSFDDLNRLVILFIHLSPTNPHYPNNPNQSFFLQVGIVRLFNFFYLLRARNKWDRIYR